MGLRSPTHQPNNSCSFSLLYGGSMQCCSSVSNPLNPDRMSRLLRIAQTSSVGKWCHNRACSSEAVSPLTGNILRILRNEIDYQSHSAPSHQPPTKFNSFAVEDRPGEQWITMTRKFGDSEDIKIEATMFDGYQSLPSDLNLHISVLVDISKAGDASNDLEFLCSAWPHRLDIQKVYVLRRGTMPRKPYLGPDFRNVNGLHKSLRGYLEARGVNDELSLFLHQYMMNKDRIELIRWLGSLKFALEK